TELRQAGMEVNDVEKQLQEGRPRLSQLETAGKADEAQMLRATLDSLEARALLARERFDTLRQSHGVLQERLQMLEQQIVSSRQQIDRLRNAPPARSAPEDKTGPSGTSKTVARVEQARQSAEKKKTEASDAEDTARSLSQRVESLKRFIALEENLLAT